MEHNLWPNPTENLDRDPNLLQSAVSRFTQLQRITEGSSCKESTASDLTQQQSTANGLPNDKVQPATPADFNTALLQTTA